MKLQILFTSILSVLLITLFSASANAQTITAGGGVGYGSQSENFNFGVNLYYSVPGAPLRIGGDIGYSIPKRDDNTRTDEIESNLNVHFMVVDEDLLSIYTITGLNMLYTRVRVTDGNTSVTESDTDPGLNIGIGGEFVTQYGRTFGEIKYVAGRKTGDSQLVVGAGIRIRL